MYRRRELTTLRSCRILVIAGKTIPSDTAMCQYVIDYRPDSPMWSVFSLKEYDSAQNGIEFVTIVWHNSLYIYQLLKQAIQSLLFIFRLP